MGCEKVSGSCESVGVPPHCVFFFFFRLLVGQLYSMGYEKVILFQLSDHYTCYMNMFPLFLFVFPFPPPKSHGLNMVIQIGRLRLS